MTQDKDAPGLCSEFHAAQPRSNHPRAQQGPPPSSSSVSLFISFGADIRAHLCPKQELFCGSVLLEICRAEGSSHTFGTK